MKAVLSLDVGKVALILPAIILHLVHHSVTVYFLGKCITIERASNELLQVLVLFLIVVRV